MPSAVPTVPTRTTAAGASSHMLTCSDFCQSALHLAMRWASENRAPRRQRDIWSGAIDIYSWYSGQQCEAASSKKMAKGANKPFTLPKPSAPPKKERSTYTLQDFRRMAVVALKQDYPSPAATCEAFQFPSARSSLERYVSAIRKGMTILPGSGTLYTRIYKTHTVTQDLVL